MKSLKAASIQIRKTLTVESINFWPLFNCVVKRLVALTHFLYLNEMFSLFKNLIYKVSHQLRPFVV
jgi:hypothetical protein